MQPFSEEMLPAPLTNAETYSKQLKDIVVPWQRSAEFRQVSSECNRTWEHTSLHRNKSSRQLPAINSLLQATIV